MILLSSGCTVLDCALGGGYPLGKIVNLVGSEATGKTLLASEMIYKARLKHGKKLLWRYNDTENKYGFDAKSMYGFEIIQDEASETFEQFSKELNSYLDELKKNQYLIYILDSLDSTSPEAEVKRFEKKLRKKETTEAEGEKKEKGSYNLEKQQELGRFFRIKNKEINDKNCLLFIISQVRMNIGVIYGPRHYRTGGKALDHQASQIIWMNEIERYTKLGRVIGVCVHAKVTKNDIGKPYRECLFDLLFDYGIDNVSTNINFLYDLKTVLGKQKKKEEIEWDGKEFTKLKLITHIEENNLEEELDKRVIKKWNDIEEAISPKNRKGKEQWKS